MGELNSPIQPTNADSIGVGVRLSESRHHRRRRTGYVQLRGLASPAFLGLTPTRLVGLLLRDVVLSRDEVDGLIEGLLNSAAVPTGATRLEDQIKGHGDDLGRRYVSELRRNYRLKRGSHIVVGDN